MITEKDIETALGICQQASVDIRRDATFLSEDELFSGDDFNAELLLMQVTYRRLLDIFPGRKYDYCEKDALMRDIVETSPGTILKPFTLGDDCSLVDFSFSLKNRRWCAYDEKQVLYPQNDGYIHMGYTDLYDIGWPEINPDAVLSPRAIVLMDEISPWMWGRHRLRKIVKVLDAELKRRELA